jgi:hypothetical protein
MAQCCVRGAILCAAQYWRGRIPARRNIKVIERGDDRLRSSALKIRG